MEDENKLIGERKSKLAALREQGNPFINDFKPENSAKELSEAYNNLSKESLDEQSVEVSVAGRMMLKRVMGKASFAQLQDSTGQIQLFVTRDELAEGFYNEQFKKMGYW